MAAGLPKNAPISAETRIICEHASACAGCPLIDSSYGDQLAFKARRVASAFALFAPRVAQESVAPAAAITEYRSRAKLMVSTEGAVGLFAKGAGHRVVDIPRCRVLAPVLVRAAAALRKIAATHPLAGSLRAVDLREVLSSGEPLVLATLVVDRAQAPSIEQLRELASEIRRAEPVFAGIAVNYRDEGAPQILGDETTLLGGVSQAPDTHGRSTHLATFGAFVQAHRGQAGRVHDEVIAALDLKDAPARVLDLYGGAGAIALAIAATGADVELVESFGPAVERVRQSAKAQNVHVHAIASDVARALRDFLQKKRTFDAIVANPPRRGISPEARERIAALGPERIAYVSCDPETLARDLDHLARLGYAAVRLQPIDMIPLTEEVETVATLRRAEPPVPRVIFENDELIAVLKEGHEPLPALEKRVRRIAGAEQATAVSPIDRQTSGVALFVRRVDLHDRWTSALRAESTTLTFLMVCRGITREKGVISHGGKKQTRPSATTRYRRLAIVGGHSLVRVIATYLSARETTETASSKHLAEIGHAPVGDARVGDPRTNRFFEEKHALDRPFVHALRLEIDSPKGSRLVLEAPLAGDLRLTLGRLAAPEVLARLEAKKTFGDATTSTEGPAAVLPEA